MEARLQPCLALPLSEEDLNEVTDKAKDWAIMHGKWHHLQTKVSAKVLKTVMDEHTL